MDTHKSQAEHLVLAALVWLLQILPVHQAAQRAVESELQVVFLSSDPLKSLQSCVSSCEGQTTPQHPCFSHAFLSISVSFSLFCHARAGSFQTSGMLCFPAAIPVNIFCKSPAAAGYQPPLLSTPCTPWLINSLWQSRAGKLGV